jgi:tetratricopeptide (TPR) repeat protein
MLRVILLFLFLVLPSSNHSFAADTDAGGHHDRGIKLYMKGNVRGAIDEFTRAIEIDPRFDRAYTNRGIMWMETGDYDKAITDINRAIEINPQQFAAFNSRGNALRFKGEFDSAIADYTTSIRLNPQSAVPYNNRGATYVNKGDLDVAIADFSRAIGIDPKYAMSYYNRGCTLYRQGKFKESLPDFQKALSAGYTPGEYAYLMLLIASQKASKEDYENAVQEFPGFVSAKSSSPWLRRIIVFYLHENVPEGMILKEAHRGYGKEKRERLCEAYYYLGEHRLSKGDRKGAEEYFQKSIGTNAFTMAEYLNSRSMLRLMEENRF